MKHSLTRRAALAGAIAAPATLIPIFAQSAVEMPTPHSDAKLLALARELERLEPAYREACEQESHLNALFNDKAPPRPDALRCRGLDTLGCGSTVERRPNGCYQSWYGAGEVAELRATPRAKWLYTGSEDDWRTTTDAALRDDPGLWRAVPDDAAQARAEMIVAAFDAWRAEREAVKAAIGLTGAEDRAETLCDARYTLFEQVLAIEAQTIEGLAAQVGAIEAQDEAAERAGFVADAVLRLAAARRS